MSIPQYQQEYQQLVQHIERLLVKGICGGFFEFSIAVRVKSADKREVLVSAGQVTQFVIRSSDLPE